MEDIKHVEKRRRYEMPERVRVGKGGLGCPCLRSVD